ncbi:hypothetical protein [Mechercharimyces sp. CAU 1602]|uniref:hypothetical protein n=1 Tax=Mechercharimyces sp. CAU 1602 TaxID=2973933 RepID=UPI002161BF4D|nr:hypothetical protein [Mechercharimyces sp. CAU 1602]
MNKKNNNNKSFDSSITGVSSVNHSPPKINSIGNRRTHLDMYGTDAQAVTLMFSINVDLPPNILEVTKTRSESNIQEIDPMM